MKVLAKPDVQSSRWAANKSWRLHLSIHVNYGVFKARPLVENISFDPPFSSKFH